MAGLGGKDRRRPSSARARGAHSSLDLSSGYRTGIVLPPDAMLVKSTEDLNESLLHLTWALWLAKRVSMPVMPK